MCIQTHLNVKGHSLKFKQLGKAPAFNPVTNICRPCLTEKYCIMF